MTDIILKLIFLVFLVCMVGIAAGALLAVIDTVRETEPETEEQLISYPILERQCSLQKMKRKKN